MEIFLSSGAFKVKSIAEILELSRKAGFKRIELSSGLRLASGDMERLQAARKEGFRFLIHNYFPAPEKPFVLNLGSTDKKNLGESRAHCRRAVDLCEELGSPFFSVHSGFAVQARPSDLGRDLTRAARSSRSDSHKVFVESLVELCGHARSRNVAIAIENNVLAPFNLIEGRNELLLGVTAEEMLGTLGDTGAANLGLLLDVAHAKVSANALSFDADEFLRQVRPKTFALHLSDNDGREDQNMPVTARSWFLPHLSAFRGLPVVLESYRLEPAEIAACCRAIESACAAEASS